MRVLRIAAGVYVLLCLLSLAIMAIGYFGWFGQEKDALGAVFAVLLAMPWLPVIDGFVSPVLFDSPAFGVFVMIAGMAINFAIILSIGKFISRKSEAGVSDGHNN